MVNEDSSQRGAAEMLSLLYGYTVQDAQGDRVGVISALWTDDLQTRVALFGVHADTGADHVVPADHYEVNHLQKELRLPLSRRAIEEAPKFVAPDEFTPNEYTRLRDYYGIRTLTTEKSTQLPPVFPLTASNLMAADGPSGVVAGESAEQAGLPPSDYPPPLTLRKLGRPSKEKETAGRGARKWLSTHAK